MKWTKHAIAREYLRSLFQAAPETTDDELCFQAAGIILATENSDHPIPYAIRLRLEEAIGILGTPETKASTHMNALHEAERILDDDTATREQVQIALDNLRTWHNAEHSTTCTCHAVIMIDLLDFDLRVWVPGTTRIVGAARQSATNRLLNAIISERHRNN